MRIRTDDGMLSMKQLLENNQKLDEQQNLEMRYLVQERPTILLSQWKMCLMKKVMCNIVLFAQILQKATQTRLFISDT